MKAPVSTAFAIGSGLIVLIGYFIPGIFGAARDTLVQWAVILAAFALLVGIVNLLSVHWHKIQASQSGNGYSILLILAFAFTVVVVGWFGPTNRWSLLLFNSVQVPVEASLLAIMAVVLIYASTRLFQRRPNVFSALFIGTVLIVLLGTTPLYLIERGSVTPLLGELRNLITQVLAVAGARGILLGVGLGAVATGLRILLGADRPYGG